jgi:hypothetical protein
MYSIKLILRKISDAGKLVLVCVTSFCFASTYVGFVKDSKTGTAIKNVRVSLGYTNSVTLTDENGKFTLMDDVATVKERSIYSTEKFDMRWSGGKAIFNFSNAPSAKRIFLFSLTGKCVYKKDLTPKNPVFQIPGFAQGVYVMKLESTGNIVSSFKINTTMINKSTCKISTRSGRQSHRSAAAASVEPLVFNHDSYYPLKTTIQDNNGNISVQMKPDPRAPVFDDTKVYTYNFLLTKEDSLKMEKDALLENYIPASFSFNDSVIGRVGIRYKGSTYSLPNCFDQDGNRSDKPECKKISLKIKFDNYDNELKFFSMKRLNLHSMSMDDSKLHDILSYGLYREMGIVAPRSAFAKVYINGTFQGVFIAVEEPDNRFASARWPEDPDGNMYKEKWPITTNKAYYKQGLETNKKPEDSADVSKIVNFNKALSASNENDFIANASKFIDLNYFLRYIAVDRAIHNADGMMTWYVEGESWYGNHNYFFYEEAFPDGKLWLIPWDLDNTFFKNDPIVDDLGVPDWNVKPVSCDPVKVWGDSYARPAHCDKLTGMTADLLWNDYVKVCEKMLASSFTVPHLTGKIDFYKQLLDTIIVRDPYVNYNIWVNNVKMLRRDITSLTSSYDDYIHKRVITADTSGFTQPFTGNGFLEPDKLNNFEFTAQTTDTNWRYLASSVNTVGSVIHNTTSPLWGKTDVCFTFMFNNSPDSGMYLEWTRAVLAFKGPQDLKKLKEIRINLKSDSNRYLSVYIDSPEYGKNKVSSGYGWYEAIKETDSIRVFKISEAAYPSWDKTNPPEILESVLSSVTGIGFRPDPHFNDQGKLASVPDTGYIRIDNIRFIYE